MDQVEEEIVNLETNIFSGFMLVSGLFIPGINKLLSISINLTPGWNHQLVNNFSEVFFSVPPGHQDSSFWGGFMNRCIWAFSPAFLGSFFPGLCYLAVFFGTLR